MCCVCLCFYPMLCACEVIVVAFLEVSFSNGNHFTLFCFLHLTCFWGQESHTTLRDQNSTGCQILNKIDRWEWSLTWCCIHTSSVLCIPEHNTLDNFYLKILREKVRSQCWNWFLGLAVSPVCTGALGMSLVLSVNFSLCNRDDSIYYGRMFGTAFIKCFED